MNNEEKLARVRRLLEAIVSVDRDCSEYSRPELIHTISQYRAAAGELLSEIGR